MNARDRIFVALDTADPKAALDLAETLRGSIGGVKVGLQLFTQAGPSIVEALRDAGHRVFVDLKLHDIPNTTAAAARQIGELGAFCFTVHALGGATMMARANEAAAEAAVAAGHRAPVTLAVTILTSHDDASLEQIGIAGPCSHAVQRLASLARDAGAGGVVCSALEVPAVRAAFPDGLRMVPGIRPAGAALDDQARVATPAGAVADGADCLVIGRPITKAQDPRAAADAIVTELEGSERLS